MKQNLHNEKIIGIVGGMGPHAGAALFNEVLRHSSATADQDHLSAILMSFPGEIVDRTLFLEGKTSVNPAFQIVKVIRMLETAGAEVVGMACNTAHASEIFGVIEEELYQADSGVKMIHMPLETVRAIREQHSGARRIGLMATNGTCRTGLYRHLLEARGYEVIQPRPAFQNNIIHRMVYDPEFGIKARCGHITDEVKILLDRTWEYFKAEGTDAIILGCTEFSLTLSLTGNRVRGMALIDSTATLAKALVREAKTAQYSPALLQ
jgi:aspartate racemase